MKECPQEATACCVNIAHLRSVHAQILESQLLQCLLQPTTTAHKKLRLSLGRYLCLDRWYGTGGEKLRRQLVRTLQPLWEKRRCETEQKTQHRDQHESQQQESQEETQQETQQEEPSEQSAVLKAFYSLGIVQGTAVHEKIRSRLDTMLAMLSVPGANTDQDDRSCRVQAVMFLQSFPGYFLNASPLSDLHLSVDDASCSSQANLERLAHLEARQLRETVRTSVRDRLQSLLAAMLESMTGESVELSRTAVRQYLHQFDHAIALALVSDMKRNMAQSLYRLQRSLLELCLSSEPRPSFCSDPDRLMTRLMQLLVVLECDVCFCHPDRMGDLQRSDLEVTAETDETDETGETGETGETVDRGARIKPEELKELQDSLACLRSFALMASSAEKALPTEAVVKQSCRLQLNLLTLFADESARLARTLHRFLLWYWHDGLPLRSEPRSLLLKGCTLLESSLEENPQEIEHCHNALLKHLLICRWQNSKQKSREHKAELRVKAAAQDNSPLPGMLAQGFSNLMKVAQADFASEAAFRKGEMCLTEELQMLEQGAARLGLEGIESLTSALLGIYQWLQQMPAGSTELALLADAHRHLQLMLNQAAAWHEIRPADECVARLHQWLQARARTLGIAMPTRADMSSEQILHSARGLALHLCAVMDLRLHFYCHCHCHCQSSCDKSSSRLPSRILDSIQHMLRFIVLERLESGDRRRRLGKPVVPSLCLTLEVQPQEVKILLEDDAAGRTLSRRHRHRLEHKCGCSLNIASVPGRGSRYHWVLPVATAPGP